MAKHKRITASEWKRIKEALELTEGNKSKVASFMNRSYFTINVIEKSNSFNDYVARTKASWQEKKANNGKRPRSKNSITHQLLQDILTELKEIKENLPTKTVEVTKDSVTF